jgi:hypothetical protein
MKNVRFPLTACITFAVASMLAGPVQAQQSWAPTPSDYQVAKMPAALTSEPIINTPAKAYFRTRLHEGASQGSNFGGHYALLQWGCGQGCTTFFIVDELNGQVYEPGFNLTAPKGTTDASFGFEYKPDSRLLVMQGCHSNIASTCGKYYMLWTGTRLDTLMREPLTTTMASVAGLNKNLPQ